MKWSNKQIGWFLLDFDGLKFYRFFSQTKTWPKISKQNQYFCWMIENRETKPLPVKKSEWFVFAMHFQDLVLSIFDSRGSAVKQYSDIVDICSVKYEFSQSLGPKVYFFLPQVITKYSYKRQRNLVLWLVDVFTVKVPIWKNLPLCFEGHQHLF